MRRSLIRLGLSIRKLRKVRSLTLAELSRRTSLTAGLLSKIENFRTIPSLPVLIKIADALETTASELLSGIGGFASDKWILSKNEDRRQLDREASFGFRYERILETAVRDLNLQVMQLTIEPGAWRQAVTTEGDQFILLLAGEIDFVLEDERIAMHQGDLLFFDGRCPHVPENTGGEAAVLLAVYLVEGGDSGRTD